MGLVLRLVCKTLNEECISCVCACVCVSLVYPCPILTCGKHVINDESMMSDHGVVSENGLFGYTVLSSHFSNTLFAEYFEVFSRARPD